MSKRQLEMTNGITITITTTITITVTITITITTTTYLEVSSTTSLSPFMTFSSEIFIYKIIFIFIKMISK